MQKSTLVQQWPRKKALAVLISFSATISVHPILAQEKEQKEDQIIEEVLITGMRSSILNAQTIKRDADSIVDSIVAEDIGKLPDRSVTEAIQRVPGVTVSHFESLDDPEHFSAEGTGVAVRGLTQIRSELNGRDIFTASGGGRALSFEDVPAELMAGVDVIKSPTADMTEGGLGGIVNLRTRMPFDSDGEKFALTAESSYGESIEEFLPSFSALYSNRFDTNLGEFGVLVDLALSETRTRTDGIYSRAWYTRNDFQNQDTVYIPIGADWRRVDFSRDRQGGYGALQWAPSNELEIYATFFRSDYDLRWDENAMFVATSSRDVMNLIEYTTDEENDSVKPVVFDDSGHFIRGSLTSGLGNGVYFGADTRISKRVSQTNDFSLGFKWNPGSQFELTGDLQYIDAKTSGIDTTVSLGVEPRYVTIDYQNGSGRPSIYADPEWLTNAENYHWSFTMPYLNNNKATEVAAKVDVEYFVNDSFISKIKMGIRVTDKDADNAESDYHWRGMYQPWMRGPADWQPFKDGEVFPAVTNTEDVELFEFNDFFRGEGSVPSSVYVPAASMVESYPYGILYLREKTDLSISDATPDLASRVWQNNQEEKTSAVYFSSDFDFDGVGIPLSGNLGVRVVQTENTSFGYINFPAGDITYTDPDTGEQTTVVNPYADDPIELPAKNDYVNVLPNLNLKYQLTEEMVFRFAAAKAISRPQFDQLKSYLNLQATRVSDPSNIDDPLAPENFRFSLDSESNPYLEPLESQQFDVSWEWYFNEVGSTHVNFFVKDIDNYIREFNGVFVLDGQEWVASWPENVGKAKLEGFEIGWNQFLSFLPEPFDGFGFQTNYTYIDSSTDTPDVAEPIDTDGSLYETLPYEGISEHSYNFIGMFEKHGWAVRLAYNWRSEYLMSVGANGFSGYNEANGVNWRLPVYADDYGQLDGSISYDVNESFTVSLSASNITNSETSTYIDQNAAGDNPASYFVHDTRYDLSVRFSY